jgi:serine/threonine protein kinase
MEILGELYVNGGNGVRVLHCRRPDGLEVVVKEVERPSDVSLSVVHQEEGDIAEKLNHPNICKVYNWKIEEREKNCYLCIEMEKGDSDLGQEIARRSSNPWAEEEIWNMLEQTVAGFRFAQKRRVCHRDVKPHNILIQSSGRVFISDFGTAKLGIIAGPAQHTLQGTLDYLSPELSRHYQRLMAGQKSGKPLHDPYRSDVYSLGLSFIQMVLLKVPDKIRNLYHLTEATEETLASLNCSEELKVLLGAMIEPEAEDRPDFLQLASMLKAIRGYSLKSTKPLPSNYSLSIRRSLSMNSVVLSIPLTLNENCHLCKAPLQLQHLVLTCGHKLCKRAYCLDSSNQPRCPVCSQAAQHSCMEICPECRKNPVQRKLEACEHSFCLNCFRGWSMLSFPRKCSICKEQLSAADRNDLA